MSLYSDVEDAVKAKLIALDSMDFQVFGTEEYSIGSNLDKVHESIVKGNLDFGCLFVFGGGNRPPRESFASAGSKGRIWYWRLGMVFFVAFKGDIDTLEEGIRNYSEELMKLLDDDHTLGGVVPLAQVLEIDGPPEEISINDRPFYAFSGTIEFWDKS